MQGYSEELNYYPGDHVAIYPANQHQLVDAILARLHNLPSPDEVVRVEVLHEKSTPLGKRVEVNLSNLSGPCEVADILYTGVDNAHMK